MSNGEPFKHFMQGLLIKLVFLKIITFDIASRKKLTLTYSDKKEIHKRIEPPRRLGAKLRK